MSDIKRYEITGKDRNGKRFKIRSSSYSYAMCINLYNGSVWAVLNTNKRKLIKRVVN